MASSNDNNPPADDVTSKVSHFVKNFFNDSPKEKDIVNIYTRTTMQKFSFHGIRATKRIFVLVVILSILGLISYWGATHEYKEIEKQYENVHSAVSKKVGHHIEKPATPTGGSSKMSNDRRNKQMSNGNASNSTDDDIESEDDFKKEESEMWAHTFPFFFFFSREDQNSTFNMTHFIQQSKKRAHAIVESMDYKKFNNWKH